MRFAFLLFGLLAVIVAVNGQNVRELTIYTQYTTIQNFHLEEDETLQLIFEVDPYSLAFVYSTLFRIPSGVFERDTLREFEAYQSSISELSPSDFTNAVSLESLYLSSNTITTLVDNVFASAPRLRYLTLAFNGITTVGANAFAGLEDLTYLSLYGNSIATLAPTVFAPLTSLSSVDLGSNQLTGISFANFENTPISTLWVENNQITEFSAGDLIAPTLINLYIYGNQISRLENDVFAQTPSLLYLSAGSNAITEIEENAFNGLSQLQSLTLYYNEISEISPSALVPLRSLYYLDLGGNQISEISFRHFSSLQYLQTLWLENNNLTQIDIRKLVSLRSLYFLYVYSNDLTQLNLRDVGFILPSLRILGLGDNEFNCGEVAQILINLRQFNIYASTFFEWDEDKIILDGIACYEYQPIEPITQQRSGGKKLLMENDPLFKLKQAIPAKDERHLFNNPEMNLIQ